MIEKDSLALSCYSQVGFNKPLRDKKSLRVYISYQPNDLSLVKKVANMILKKHNCTVYFFDYQKYQFFSFESLKTLLSEMNIVLFLVTPHYLNNHDNSFLKEYPFFKDGMFPMLPILFDVSTLAKYESVFGDIQCVRWVNNIEIRLNEEFETLVSINRLSKEVQFDINDVFKKKLFLSYRRVDKHYALEAIKQIHSNPYNQDIAIWYDDFLIPGIDYDMSIVDEIKEADLCLFLITPHILEGDNYVKTIEYVKAREMNKVIVPIVIEDTDYNLLKNGFPSIGIPVGLIEASDHLKDFYQNGSIYDADPETIFQIGVAYLQGVGVEHNVEIALKLLEAASQKSNKAKRFLAEMYFSGKRVTKDYKKYLEITLDLLYHSLNYDYESLNEDDEFLLKSISGVIDVITFTYGQSQKLNQFVTFINETLPKFNFEEGSDGYYLYIATYVYWQILQHGVNDAAVAEQLYPLVLKLYNRDDYYSKEVCLYGLFVHYFSSLISTNGQQDKETLRKIKALGEQLLHINPLRFCKLPALTVILQNISSFPYEEAIDLCDSLMSFIDSFTIYSSELEPIKKVLYVEKVFVLIRYDYKTILDNFDEFLKEYRIEDPFFLQTNPSAIEYYQKALIILGIFEEYDLAIEAGKSLLELNKKYEKIAMAESVKNGMVSTLSFLTILSIKKGDYDAAKKYLEEYKKIGINHSFMFVTTDFGTIYGAEILIHIHNGNLNAAHQCLMTYQQIVINNVENTSSFNTLFLDYVNTFLTYALAVDSSNSIDSHIKEVEKLIFKNFEDEFIVFATLKTLAFVVFDLKEKGVDISNDHLFHYFNAFKRIYEMADDPGEKRAYLLDTFALFSGKKYAYFSKEEIQDIKKRVYELSTDFIIKYPQYVSDTTMDYYYQSFADIYRKLYYDKNDAETFSFCKETCETCHALFSNLKDQEINYEWFTPYIMAFSVCAALDNHFDYNLYKQDIIKIKDNVIINFKNLYNAEFYEEEKDIGYRIHLYIAILIADFVFLRDEEQTVKDHLEITKKCLKKSSVKECQTFHTAIKDLFSNFDKSSQLEEYFSFIELLDQSSKIIMEGKRPSSYPFEDYLLSYKYTYPLAREYIYYFLIEKVDDLCFYYFYFFTIKVILKACQKETSAFLDDPCLEVILNDLCYFARKLADFNKKFDAPYEEIKQIYDFPLSVLNCVILYKPTYTKAKEKYCESLFSLLFESYQRQNYKEFMEVYLKYYPKVIGKTHLKIECQLFILHLLYIILRNGGLSDEEMKKLVLDCYEQWEYVMDQDFYPNDFLEDRFDDFAKYDSDNSLFYDSLKIIFCKDELNLDAYDIVIRHFIDKNKGEQALYLCQKELTKLNSLNGKQEQYERVYSNLAKTYQLMGDENKFQEYYLMTKNFK